MGSLPKLWLIHNVTFSITCTQRAGRTAHLHGFFTVTQNEKISSSGSLTLLSAVWSPSFINCSDIEGKTIGVRF